MRPRPAGPLLLRLLVGLLLGLLALTGCPRPALIVCAADADCGAGQRCQADGSCAPPAPAPLDAGAPDASDPGPSSDAGELEDPRDSGPADSGPTDSGPTDGGPTDSDAGAPLDAGDAECAARYGGVSGYLECAATPTTCEFNASTSDYAPNTCRTVCELFGGVCLGAIDNDGPCDLLGGNDTCDTTRGTEYCICSR